MTTTEMTTTPFPSIARRFSAALAAVALLAATSIHAAEYPPRQVTIVMTGSIGGGQIG